MSHFAYSELLNASGGTAWTQEKPFETARLWTDTRTLAAGDFFLPLSGERFDGHDYLEQAFEAGAVGAFIQRQKAERHPEWQSLPNLIAVEEPVRAYLAMARLHRRKINPKVIAVTGSSGKTTTKEMLAAALSPLKKTVKTAKNFNNEVGVSQTLLALQPGDEVLIVEMGMRGLRQISLLSEAAEPDVALIASIGPAHIEFLGSLENIARAKLEIVEGMDPARGTLVINGDAPHLPDLAPQLWPGKTVAYHLSEAQNLRSVTDGEATGVQFEFQGTAVRLPVTGVHMVANALGVLKVGQALGCAPEALAGGLACFAPEQGRGEQVVLSGYANVRVINDAYNANPDSARAAISAFLSVERPDYRQILVVGGMKELGEQSRTYHEDFGRWLAGQSRIDAVFTVGAEADWMAAAMSQAPFPVSVAPDVDTLVGQLLRQHPNGLENAILYLKGSRAYRLDEIPQRLMAQGNSLQAGDKR